MYRLEEETEADWWEVEALYDLCFAPGRTALSSYRLRDGVPMVKDLCHVLRDGEGILAAVIRYWPAEVAGRITELGRDRTIFLAVTEGYKTLEGKCEAIQNTLVSARGAPRILVTPDERNEDEPGMQLLEFPAP